MEGYPVLRRAREKCTPINRYTSYRAWEIGLVDWAVPNEGRKLDGVSAACEREEARWDFGHGGVPGIGHHAGCGAEFYKESCG